MSLPKREEQKQPQRMTLSKLGVDPLNDVAKRHEMGGAGVASQLQGASVRLSPKPRKPGRLYAIADLHLSFPGNRKEWLKLRHFPNDGLIICGDAGESREHLDLAFSVAKERFGTVWWTPGNHELYTLPTEAGQGARGEAKYEECVRIARGHGVLTPEDPFLLWEGEGGPCVVAPIFTLYDYSFRPDHVSLEGAVKWAKEKGVEATDEFLLHHEPYRSRQEWCYVLLERFRRKLEEAQAAYPGIPTVIANHWPLREDLVYLRFIPRFSIWCGTKKTEDWHKRFNAKVVVSGHLHLRRTDWKDGTRFEECSLGYPRQNRECLEAGMDVNDFLREILPGPEAPASGNAPTLWRRCDSASVCPELLFTKRSNNAQ